jgi:hypothetical protein
MRKSNGQLHYYINGQDQGVASNETPQTIWGVVDLYGMAVKVTILDRNDPNYPNNVQNTVTRNNVFRHFHDLYDQEALEVTNVGMCYKHFGDLLLYQIVSCFVVFSFVFSSTISLDTHTKGGASRRHSCTITSTPGSYTITSTPGSY